MVRTFARTCVLVATLALFGACAPITFAPVGLNLSNGFGAPWTAMSQCSVLGSSPEATRMGIRSSAIQAGVIRNRVQQIQSNLQFGYSPGPNMEGWKRIASGEC